MAYPLMRLQIFNVNLYHYLLTRSDQKKNEKKEKKEKGIRLKTAYVNTTPKGEKKGVYQMNFITQWLTTRRCEQ